ncbi:MAG TPA: VOC family protein [Candidatus Sulfotelmatobacter sp.]|nr:VOC family protein [Candidatus Sulfotelmatobacter sp.]
MPKRSLKHGNGDSKKIEQLNTAIEAMLARNDGRVVKAGAEIEPLARIAADLRNLPNASFKARLKSELEGKRRMPTVAEPVTSTHVSATPRIAFRDPSKAIEFYKRALGAKEMFRFQVGDDIPHAELRIGDSSINIAGEWPEGGRFSAETLGNSPISMSVQVDDVDSFAEHAVAEGMKLVREPKDQFYGHRDALLQDPFGYSWAVFTVKEQMSAEEMHRRMKGMMTGPEGGEASKKTAVSPVPQGFRMVTPYLVAENGLALLDFVKEAFGAEEIMRAVMPAGVHAEVRMGDSVLMMGGGLPGKKPPTSVQPNALHVYVEDADAVCKKAVAAGATLIDDVRDQDYSERSGTVKDQAGNFWYVATYQGEGMVPKGLHNVNPYLHPRRAEPLISFLKRAFEAEEVAKYASPDGVVNHAVIRVGDAVIEMGEAHGKYETMPAMFYLYVPNMETVYRQALAAGATSIQEPTDQPYGDRNAAVKDAFGNKWYIATHVKDVQR